MQAFAAKLGTIPTTVLRLDNMVKAVTLLDAQEYSEVRNSALLPHITRLFVLVLHYAPLHWLAACGRIPLQREPSEPTMRPIEHSHSTVAVSVQLVEDVQEEAKRYGAMQSVFVPRPPPTVTPDEPARVFIRLGTALSQHVLTLLRHSTLYAELTKAILTMYHGCQYTLGLCRAITRHLPSSCLLGMSVRRYSQPTESEAAKKVFDGRTFDGNRISARYVSEDDLKQAETGVWNQAGNGSLPPPPGACILLLVTRMQQHAGPADRVPCLPKPNGCCGHIVAAQGIRATYGLQLRVCRHPMLMPLCLACSNDRVQSPSRGRAARTDGVSQCHGAGHARTAASCLIPRRISSGRAAGSASRVRRAASGGCQHAGGRERGLGEAPRRQLHGQQAGLHGVLPGGHRLASSLG